MVALRGRVPWRQPDEVSRSQGPLIAGAPYACTAVERKEAQNQVEKEWPDPSRKTSGRFANSELAAIEQAGEDDQQRFCTCRE